MGEKRTVMAIQKVLQKGGPHLVAIFVDFTGIFCGPIFPENPLSSDIGPLKSPLENYQKVTSRHFRALRQF